MLYNALRSSLPAFGHVPMLLGKDRTRLSKRHGAMSVTAYRDMGYLPDALINYLVRLGWSYGDQEFFTREELIEKFTLENIGKSPGFFDQEKLLAFNTVHIKAASPGNLSGHLLPFLKERGCMAEKGDFLDSVIKTLNTRSKTLIDMADASLFYYAQSISYEEKAAKKHLKPASLSALQLLIDQLESLDIFSEKALENVFTRVMDNTGLKLGKIAQPVRVALTGKTVSPGIFEIIEVLGKKQVISRLKNAVRFIKDRED